METKTVAITMGDPAGIGPEIIVKALSEDGLNGAPLVVIDARNVETFTGEGHHAERRVTGH